MRIIGSSSGRLSSEHPLPSVLDILKSPTPSELTRKRKVASNKPPVGRKRGKGRVTSSPMSVRPLDHVKSYPGGFCLIVDIVVANPLAAIDVKMRHLHPPQVQALSRAH